MSKNLEHILHASILGFLLYFIMTLFLGQNSNKACGRSIILASISLIYMIMYGHNFPPGRINSSLL